MNSLENIIKSSGPVYSLINIEQNPVNPYRELMYYCISTVYSNMENKLNLSFLDFAELPVEKQKQILSIPESYCDGVTVSFESSIHKKVLYKCIYKKDNTILCELMFYSYTDYVKDKDAYAVEIKFVDNPIFDFLDINRDNNYFDFVKDETTTANIDIVLSFIKVFANDIDFLGVFKAKALVTKNIKMFADKLIKPYVTDMNILFAPNYFIIGAIHGINIIKKEYSYDNYFNSIKEFAADIKERYGSN